MKVVSRAGSHRSAPDEADEGRVAAQLVREANKLDDRAAWARQVVVDADEESAALDGDREAAGAS